MLFAEVSNEGAAGLVVLSGIASQLGNWLVSLWREKRKERLALDREARAEERADEATNTTRFDVLLKRVDAEREALIAKVDLLLLRATAAEVKAERAVTWIRALEDRLEEKQIPFRRWEDGPVPVPAPPTTRMVAPEAKP